MTVREGRFGPYVTDGETNASLRKGDDVETITLERAAELLADRRARGPATKKKAAKKTTAKKAPAKKKAAAKKAAPVTAGPRPHLSSRASGGLPDGEHPPEGQHGGAVVPARVGRAQGGGVLRGEGGRGVAVEAGQHRPQHRAAHPAEHRVLAREHVQVRGLPDVGGEPGGGQHVEVADRLQDGVRSWGGVGEPVGPARRAAELGEQRVRGCPEVARHLHRQPAARRQPLPPTGQAASAWPGTQCSTALLTTTSTGPVGFPGRGRRPATNSSRPGTATCAAAASISGEESTPVTRAPGQRARSDAVSVPSPQPRSTTRRGRRRVDAAEQIGERPGPLAGVPQVGRRVPGGRGPFVAHPPGP